MATEIKATLEELKNIAQEVHNLNKSLKELRLRKKELEYKVVQYLDSNDKPGIKLDNIVFLTADKNVRARKAKDDILNDSVEILNKYGVKGDPKTIINELIDARKGEVSKESVLKMKAAGIFS